MDYSLQEILDNVEQIREAIYGEEVRGSISNSIEMMAYETDTVQGFKDSVNQTLENYKTEYEKNFRDFADSVHRDMDKHVKDMDEKYGQFTYDIELKFNNHKAEMDNNFFEFKQSVNLTIANFTNDMTAKMDTIQDEWLKFQQATNLELSNFKMEMLNKYQEFTEQIIAENSALKESVKTDIAGMKNDIMNFEETVNNTLAKYQQELGETITELHNQVDTKLAQNTTEIEAIKKEIYDKLEEASQADPNLELVDAREGEPTLKANLNKNYVKKPELEPLQTSISELKSTTETIGGRTDTLEDYVTKHPNPVLTINKNSPDEEGNIDIEAGVKATPVTYSELTTLISDNKLNTGGIYLLTDYKTVYQEPTRKEIKSGETEELYLTATSPNTLSPISYSKQYPEDIIIYDVNNKVAEDKTTPRNGFILRRTDTVNSLSAPQDWRNMKWLRYDTSDTHYYNGTENVPYEIWQKGQETKLDVIYRVDNELYIAYRKGIPDSKVSATHFVRVCSNIGTKNYAKTSTMEQIKLTPKLALLTGNAEYIPTFGTGCQNIYIGDTIDNSPHNNVFHQNCRNIILEKQCRHNTFGSNTNGVTFASNCSYNTFTFVSGNTTFGTGSTNNLIINSHSNTLGSVSSYNTFIQSTSNVLGTSISSNTFIYSNQNILNTSSSINMFIKSNEITLNQYCTNNTFDVESQSIILGNDCLNNTFGERCINIEFSTACVNNTLESTCANISMENSCRDNKIGSKVTELHFSPKSSNNTIGENSSSINIMSSSGSNIIPPNTKALNIYGLISKDLTSVPYLTEKRTKHITVNNAGNPVMSFINGTTTIETIPIP